MDKTETTVVAKGTKIIGKMELSCKLHIDGEIDGEVNSDNVVTIGASGSVKGEIFAQKLMVSGVLDGNANCETIEILSNGRIAGDIISKNLVIESQGQFEGSSKIKVADSDNLAGKKTTFAIDD